MDHQQWQPSAPSAPALISRRDIGARWIGIIGVVVGVVGLSVAVWAVAQIRQAPMVSNSDARAVEYSDDEVLAAKQQICEASRLVANAVGNSGAPVNPDDDVALRNANVALSQVAFLAGATYLENRLNSAAPAELRETVEVQIERYLRAVVGGASGGGPTYETDVAEADVAAEEVNLLCH